MNANQGGEGRELGQRRRRGRLFFILLCFLSLWLPASPARAAGLSLEYFLGFDGRFRLGAWTPLRVVLENRGVPLRGVLEVVVTTGSEYYQNVHAATYAAPVDLPTQARKGYTFAVHIASFSHPLVMRVVSDGRVVLTQALNLRPYYVTAPFFLVLGERISPDLFGQLPAGGVPAAPSPRLLPVTWYGFEGVEMVLLEPGALTALTPDQAAALAEWVRAGGFVVLSGGWRYEPLLSPQARRLLPISVQGIAQPSALKGLEAFGGRPWSGPGPVPVVQASIQGAELLAFENGLPLILQKDVGYGRVVFLAFDPFSPPFSRWAGQRSFWGRVYGLKPAAPPGPIPLPAEALEQEMLAELPAGFPSFVWTLSFLAAYVALVGVMLHRLEHTRTSKRTLALALPLAAVVFSALSLGLLYIPQVSHGRSFSRFVHVRVPADGRPARLETILGLYAVRPTFYRIRLAGAGSPVLSLGATRAADLARQDEVLSEENGRQTIEVRLPSWSHRFFHLQGFVDLGLKAEARLDEAGLEVAVDNPTSQGVRGVRIAYDGRLFDFGDVPPGRRLVRRLDRARLLAESGLDLTELKRVEESPPADFEGRLRQRIERRVFEIILSVVKSRARPEAITLFGWLDSDPLSLEVHPGDAVGGAVRLFEWDVPLRGSGGGSAEGGRGAGDAG